MTAKGKDTIPSTRKGRGKQIKHFLDNQSAVSLAASIADEQEARTTIKSDRIHQSAQRTIAPTEKKPSAAKLRFKEKKKALISERAQHKKAKAQLRKKGQQPTEVVSRPPGDDSGPAPPVPTRKRVSFA